jgi:hypothetical protein
MLLLESQKRSIRVLFVSRFDDKVHDAVSGESRIESLRIDPKEDLGIQIAVQSQALIQEKFNQTELKIISEKKGKFDFIVCCRMLEHAYEPVELIKCRIVKSRLNKLISLCCGRSILATSQKIHLLIAWKGMVLCVWKQCYVNTPKKMHLLEYL